VKIDLSRIQLTGWKRTAAYVAFFVLAFLWALHATFPTEAVKERLILEAAAQGWQVRLNDIAPRGLLGVQAREVTLQTRDGSRIPLDEVRVSLRPLALLSGRSAVAFDAALFDGTVSGVTERGSTVQRLRLHAAGIDLGKAGALRKATGLDLAGTLGADLDVTLDAKDPARNAGTVELGVKGAAVRGGEVPVPGMSSGLTVPPMGLGTVAVHGTVKGPRADFDKVEARGGDVELTGEQAFVQLQPKVENSPLAGRARVRFAEAFWQRGTAATLRPVIDAALASAKLRDGGFGFQIYGTVGRPQARPMAF
jgi:type II secretion system protein N